MLTFFHQKLAIPNVIPSMPTVVLINMVGTLMTKAFYTKTYDVIIYIHYITSKISLVTQILL